MKTKRTRLQKNFEKVLICKVGGRKLLFFDNKLEVDAKTEKRHQKLSKTKEFFSVEKK